MIQVQMKALDARRYRRVRLLWTVMLFVSLGTHLARAQSTGATVDVCSSGTVDSSFNIEETICLSGSASYLDSYVEVDDDGYEEYGYNAVVVEVGADAQLNGPAGVVSDSGEQQGSNAYASAGLPYPEVGAWYYLNGLYDECIDPTYSGRWPCNWSGLMSGYSVSAEITSAPPPTLSVVTSATPSIYTHSVTFTATISHGPTGSLTFYDGGVSIGTGTISGTTATLSTSTLTPGNHSITAAWAGNTYYSAVTSSAINEAITQGVIYSYSIVGPGGASGYAPNGNVVNYTDSVTGVWSNIAYDGLNRLSAGTQTPGSGISQSFCWTYDSYGNRTAQATSDHPFANATGASTCQVASGATLYSNAWTTYTTSGSDPGNNRVVSGPLGSYSYDGAGDVISDTTNGYTYDGEGRLCAVAAPQYGGGVILTQYLYDADGNRVGKGTNTNTSAGCDTSGTTFTLTATYVLGPSGEQLDEVNGSGAWTHTNVFAGGSLVATYDGSANNTVFSLTDWLGTKRAEFGANGCATGYTSMPFGDGLTPVPASGYTMCADDATEHHFTGKERDTESGLDYFGARYMASSMGRFMSPDYSDDDSQGEPIPYFNPSNPQTLNLYSYAHNNPMTGSDPDGHSVNVCTNDASGNQHCTLMSNEQYQAASQGNGSLNVPTLDQVGSNGNGSGQFNSTAITDSSGNTVGTATYVSDGGADYYANANGYQTLATASRGTKQVTAGYAVVFGAVGAGMVAADIAAGAELTTLGDLSPNAQFTEHGVQRLAQRGITPGQVQEAIDAAKKAGDVAQKVGKYGTKQLEYTANGLKVFVEQEGANAGKVITAYFH